MIGVIATFLTSVIGTLGLGIIQLVLAVGGSLIG